MPLFAFEKVYFALDSLQLSSHVETLVSVVFGLVLCLVLYLLGVCSLKVKLWSLAMCPGHAMSLRHDGLDLDMPPVSSLEVRFWVCGHRVT